MHCCTIHRCSASPPGAAPARPRLLVKILPMLRAQGLRVGMLKHAHHEFDIDHPGKDSYELRKAGAEQMLVASSQRWALMVEATGAG
jgi:molybdopterin-guanine dinucleotide biosynthesis protein MobB